MQWHTCVHVGLHWLQRDTEKWKKCSHCWDRAAPSWHSRNAAIFLLYFVFGGVCHSFPDGPTKRKGNIWCINNIRWEIRRDLPKIFINVWVLQTCWSTSSVNFCWEKCNVKSMQARRAPITALGYVLAVGVAESHCCNCYSAQKLKMFLSCKQSDLQRKPYLTVMCWVFTWVKGRKEWGTSSISLSLSPSWPANVTKNRLQSSINSELNNSWRWSKTFLTKHYRLNCWHQSLKLLCAVGSASNWLLMNLVLCLLLLMTQAFFPWWRDLNFRHIISTVISDKSSSLHFLDTHNVVFLLSSCSISVSLAEIAF